MVILILMMRGLSSRILLGRHYISDRHTVNRSPQSCKGPQERAAVSYGRNSIRRREVATQRTQTSSIHSWMKAFTFRRPKQDTKWVTSNQIEYNFTNISREVDITSDTRLNYQLDPERLLLYGTPPLASSLNETIVNRKSE